VAASAASGALCVTTTIRADPPPPGAPSALPASALPSPVWRAAAMLTPWRANSPVIVESTPARSTTSRLTW
jgi:hypothetical protein